MEKMSHGIVSQAVYSGVQVGRDPAARTGRFYCRSGAALEINPKGVQSLAKKVSQRARHAFPGRGQRRWSEGRIAELERKIGQQTLEIDFLKGCLQRIEEQRMLQASNGNP